MLQSPAYSSLLLDVPSLASELSQHAWVVTQGADWGDPAKPGMVAMLNDIAS